MTVPYTKTNVGNKLFTIEWDLELTDAMGSVSGDVFEAVDCELLSIHATTLGVGALSKFNFSNKNSASVSINIGNPDNNIIIEPPFPSVRFYSPTLEEAEATLAVALLFKEI
ncbi:MAG TPA: hypothetical protein VMT30_02155 [Candidatus Saccharimonadia bacterium]|nr:hypothetical protein [Candidatus Saccharimonadia bacterium]